ncbi:unnamed protein product [Sphagnum jensenii]|uniref:Uncharacterized protein n=1 Tax=Sphagnum jensenii TaxID=128206 RepID=A0ABP0X296_9BRYO
MPMAMCHRCLSQSQYHHPPPFFSHTELQSIADPEIKRNSSFVSSPAESLHNSPPTSLLIAGAPSSSISFTRKPVSTAGFEERLVRISKRCEGQIPECLPHLPVVSFLNQDIENARKCVQEEFLSLEQHIEDLTQEKICIAVKSLRAMAEYSVLENTALVEDFNNQLVMLNYHKPYLSAPTARANEGQVVQKLNDDIVLLEEKVLAQEAMLKSLRAERDKAQQESSSAIGWSETLAGEVIALENRLCNLQSHELRLKRDMESLTSDLHSYKQQQIASLEKD